MENIKNRKIQIDKVIIHIEKESESDPPQILTRHTSMLSKSQNLEEPENSPLKKT